MVFSFSGFSDVTKKVRGEEKINITLTGFQTLSEFDTVKNLK